MKLAAMLKLCVLAIVLTSLPALTSAGKTKKSKKVNAFNVTMEAVLSIEVKNYNGEGDDINGKITVGLFGETVPASALNFKALCNGFKRPQLNDKVGYKNTYCHKVVKDMLVQCGDVFNTQGRSGTSIYGESFNDENFDVSHTSGGVVSYANRGKNTNGSQFFFTIGPSRFLDKKHVAFGKVTKGFQYVQMLNRIGSNHMNGWNFPKRPIRITECDVEQVKPYLMSEAQMKIDDLEGIVKM